jgi:TolA-binding protein
MRMNRAEDEGLGMRAEELTDLARTDGTDMTVQQRAYGFQRLKVTWQARSRARGGLVPLVVTLSAMIATLTLVAAKLGMFSKGESSLSYELHSGHIDKNGAIEGEPLERPTLRFSDGTEVALSPGSRARLQSVHGHGARIDLDGQAEVRVVHWPGAQWLFDAGPFLIQVKGTEFVADWKKTEEQLEVRLVKGSVAVSGPVLQDPIILHAGQKLTIHVREKEMLIRDIDSPASADATVRAAESGWIGMPPTTPTPLPSREPVEKRSHSSPAPASTNPSPRRWAAALASGKVDTILEQAESGGIEATLSTAGPDDIAALADAARYRQREDLARNALRTQRRRFPGSRWSSDAAFLLARLEETGQRLGVALAWYERYLNEAPTGAYAAEALGRKMTVLRRLSGDERARPVAHEYLRRFPGGTYASTARAIASTP